MIVICTPTRDTVNAGFAYDLVNLVRYNSDAVFAVTQGTYLSNLRSLLVKTSLQNGASHILFIDSDMRFPHDSLDRLLAHDADIVGANYRQRTQEGFTARKDGSFITSKDKTGLEEVDTMGMGVTLIKADVFKKLPEPWFDMPFVGDKHVGEDVSFCNLARSHGFKIMVDHDLSQQIKHAGLIEFAL